MNFEMCMKRACKQCKNNKKCFREGDEKSGHFKSENSNNAARKAKTSRLQPKKKFNKRR